MKIKLGWCGLFILCVLASAFRSALAEWVRCEVDGQFSVQLPVAATEMDMLQVFASQGVTPSPEQAQVLKSMKVFTATDGAANYMVTRMATGLAASLEEPGNRTRFYDGAVNGVLLKEHGTLLQRAAFTVNGTEGVEVRYRGVHKGTGKKVIKYNRWLAVGPVVYMLAVYPVDRNDSTGVGLQEPRTKFFNSMAYRPSPAPSK
ncbi:hypothetical protein [Hymenobacter terricola]|uniref:hypothetical protein n=1 Tax=Hymenobacter terricola TaxID=2819236 RepID=UPI001B303E97|nr:hypothetical protein [Hymenobacter terricola]